MDPSALTRHGEAIATARAFARRAGALRVALLLDTDGATTLVEVDAGGAAEVTEGEESAVVPAGMAVAAPRALPDVRATPPSAISIDLDSGELSAPIGAIDHLAGAVLALAQAFGGLTVATAEFPTRDPATPITFAAREGERVLLAAGDAQYEL